MGRNLSAVAIPWNDFEGRLECNGLDSVDLVVPAYSQYLRSQRERIDHTVVRKSSRDDATLLQECRHLQDLFAKEYRRQFGRLIETDDDLERFFYWKSAILIDHGDSDLPPSPSDEQRLSRLLLKSTLEGELGPASRSNHFDIYMGDQDSCFASMHEALSIRFFLSIANPFNEVSVFQGQRRDHSGQTADFLVDKNGIAKIRS